MGWKPGCSDHQQSGKNIEIRFFIALLFAVSSEASWSLGLGTGSASVAARKEQQHKAGEDSPICGADGVDGSQSHPGSCSVVIITLPSNVDGEGTLQHFLTLCEVIPIKSPLP